MPKVSYGPVEPSAQTRRAEGILECTSLFAEALDDLNLEARLNFEENQKQESAARRDLGLPPNPAPLPWEAATSQKMMQAILDGKVEVSCTACDSWRPCAEHMPDSVKVNVDAINLSLGIGASK
jgi:hypothetical protein